MRGDRFGPLFANPVLEASDSVIPPVVKESYKVVISKPMDYSTVKVGGTRVIFRGCRQILIRAFMQLQRSSTKT